MRGPKLVAIAFALVAAGFAAPARAETARSCESLASLDFSKVADKPAHVVAASEGQFLGRAVCEVSGAVEPKVQFRLRLPMQGWDGRYLQTGCGGLCGRITDEVHQVYGCAPFQKVEMAVATTDMGHEGPTPDFGDDPQLRVDFAYRGVHVTAEVAKAIVAAFYGRSAERAYFIGCSDGGREGLMEAERYPADFDGIAAGAPAFNFHIQNTFYHAWNARSNTGPDGKPIIVAADLPFLHRAALKACHAEDGVIADPRRCAFDPVSALCATGQDADCLTADQVEAARKIYEGPRTADGVWLTVGGPQPGSELSWAGVYVPKPGSDDIFGRVIAGGTISHIAFDPNPPKTFGLNDLGFDRETFERLKPMHSLRRDQSRPLDLLSAWRAAHPLARLVRPAHLAAQLHRLLSGGSRDARRRAGGSGCQAFSHSRPLSLRRRRGIYEDRRPDAAHGLGRRGQGARQARACGGQRNASRFPLSGRRRI